MTSEVSSESLKLGVRVGADVIKFYSTRGTHGCFSNFSKHPIVMDGQKWPTVEHFYQAQKTVDPARRELIRNSSHAGEAAALGRSRETILRTDWDALKVDLMCSAVLQKFKTHEGARRVLLSTGSALLIEDSPVDWFWGCGEDGKGQNMLGLVLMQVRQALREAGS